MTQIELQSFFKERLVEIFHNATLDSYRVRTHNALSLLKELKGLVIGWQKNQIKQFETINLCIEEAIDSLKEDTCIDFSYFHKSLFINSINNYKSKAEKDRNEGNELLFQLNKLIQFNENKYVSNLFNVIEEYLLKECEFEEKEFIPKLQNLDNYISALCCELICMKYSKTYLYRYVFEMNKSTEEFPILLQQFKERFQKRSSNSYIVIFRLNISNKSISVDEFPEFVKEIPSLYLNQYLLRRHKKFVTPNKSIYYYIKEIDSFDYVTAVAIAKEGLSTLLDMLHLGMSNLNVVIRDNALVLESKGSYYHVYYENVKSLLDGVFSNDLALSRKLVNDINNINGNPNISKNVKDRINSAIRHLRIGNTNIEIEQQFINYWIALEFVFSSPETHENTFGRLNKNLTTIMSSCYAKRNLLALNEILIKKERIQSGTYYWDRDDVDEFIDKESSILLKYRLKKMKSRLFQQSEKRKIYIKKHEKNLSQHIARIYRMRNELIHEAAIRQDIENVTSNLRYYLVFVLNQIIVYFTNNLIEGDSSVELEDFFYEFENYKNVISLDWTFESLMNIPLEMDLLK